MYCLDISFYVFLSPLFLLFSFPQSSISAPFYSFLFLSSSSSPLFFLPFCHFLCHTFTSFKSLCPIFLSPFSSPLLLFLYFFFFSSFSFTLLSFSLISLFSFSILAFRTCQTQGSIKWLAFNFYPRTTKYQGKKRDYLYA